MQPTLPIVNEESQNEQATNVANGAEATEQEKQVDAVSPYEIILAFKSPTKKKSTRKTVSFLGEKRNVLQELENEK